MRNVDMIVARVATTAGNKTVSNTVIDSQGDITQVILHGHTIATINHADKTLSLDNCGFATNVTHARMNGLLAELGIHATAKTNKGVTTFIDRQNKVIGTQKHTFSF